MNLRIDETGVNFENLKTKVVSYSTNKTEQTRGGQKAMCVPMDVDKVSGSMPEQERLGGCGRGSRRVDVLQLRDGTLRKRLWMERQGQGEGGDGGKGYGETTKGTVPANF